MQYGCRFANFRGPSRSLLNQAFNNILIFFRGAPGTLKVDLLIAFRSFSGIPEIRPVTGTEQCNLMGFVQNLNTRVNTQSSGERLAVRCQVHGQVKAHWLGEDPFAIRGLSRPCPAVG